MSRNIAAPKAPAPERQIQLRIQAVVLAVSVSNYPSPARQRLVIRVRQLARDVVGAGLRVTYDGDRYYLTQPFTDSEPQLFGSEHQGCLRVIGTADHLQDLSDLVDNQVLGHG